MSPRYLSPDKTRAFPNLPEDSYIVSSDDTWNALVRYNCIAHAAGDRERWWWPDSQGLVGYVVYWPPGVDFEVTLKAFIDAFRTKGFVPCEEMNTELEPGCEKVVLYTDPDTNEPTHAALQLPSGSWTSKLGDWEDIDELGM
jgi:hypothetical protein